MRWKNERSAAEGEFLVLWVVVEVQMGWLLMRSDGDRDCEVVAFGRTCCVGMVNDEKPNPKERQKKYKKQQYTNQ
jgi:hypothetical protein